MVASRGEGLVVRTTIACGVLETLAVIFRLLAQWKNNRRFYRDDWWIVASLVPSYAMLAVGILSEFSLLPCMTASVDQDKWLLLAAVEGQGILSPIRR